MVYESPKLTEVGSVRDLTLGKGLRGDDDSFMLFGYEITYGTS